MYNDFRALDPSKYLDKVSPGRTATVVIAAVDASLQARAQADFVCDGTDDQVEIQAAIDALPAGGGEVKLLEGNYVKSNTAGISIPSNTGIQLLAGAIIRLANGLDANADIFVNADTANGNSNIVIEGGTLDTNVPNQAAGQQYAINFTLVSHSRVDTAIKGEVNLRESSVEFINKVLETGYLQPPGKVPHSKGAVTICYDDCANGIYNALATFKAKGKVGCLCVRTGAVGQAGYMTWAQIDEFHDAGFEIVSHGKAHPELGLTEVADVEDALKDSQKVLREHGYEANVLAYNKHWFDGYIRQATRRYYAAARGRGEWNGINVKPIDKYALSSHLIGQAGDTIGGLQALVQEASNSGAWLIFHSHASQDGYDTGILDQCIALDVPVVTMSQGLEMFKDSFIDPRKDPSNTTEPNLLWNGTFERGLAGWGTSGAAPTVDNTVYRLPWTQSMKFVAAAGNSHLRGQGYIKFPHPVKYYLIRLSAWVKGEDVDGVLRVRCYLREDGGTPTFNDSTMQRLRKLDGPQVAGTFDWTYVEAEIVQCLSLRTLVGNELNVDYFGIWSQSATPGTIWMSDVRLTAIPLWYPMSTEPTKIQHSDLFMDILAASANHVVAAADLTAAPPIACGIAAQPDVPRNITIIITDANASIDAFQIDVIGVNAKGQAATEQFLFAGGLVQTGNVAWTTITSVTVTSINGDDAGDVLDVGIGSKLGLSNIIYVAADVYKVKRNNAHYPTASYTVNATYCTVNVSTGGAIVDGDDFTIWFRSNLNIIA